MKVKYGENVYTFEGDLNCVLFSSLIEEGIEEVELVLYEDIFKLLHTNRLSFKKIKNETYLYQALTYFGSNKEKELIKYLYNKIYKQEHSILQKEIEDFFEMIINSYFDIDWNILVKNKSLSENFFKKYLHKMNSYDKNALCENVSLKFINKYLIEYWPAICKNTNISELLDKSLSYFEENINNIDWSILCSNPSIPVSFFEKHINKINWQSVSQNTSIPEEFFEKYIFHVNWFQLCQNTSISESFFRKHLDMIDWYAFFRNPKQFNLQRENLDMVIYGRLAILMHCPYDYIKGFEIDKINMQYICKNPNVPLSFFKKHIDLVDWERISKNPSVPFSFYKDHIGDISCKVIFKNPNIPISFFRENDYWKTDVENILFNHFNLEQRVKDKIKNTKYFDFEPLNVQIKIEK